MSGPQVTLSANNVIAPTFTSPTVTSDTVLEFKLTVNNHYGLSAQDTVKVTVKPKKSGGSHHGGGGVPLLITAVLALLALQRKRR